MTTLIPWTLPCRKSGTFNEADHSRASDGRFGSGGGGSAPSDADGADEADEVDEEDEEDEEDEPIDWDVASEHLDKGRDYMEEKVRGACSDLMDVAQRIEESDLDEVMADLKKDLSQSVNDMTVLHNSVLEDMAAELNLEVDALKELASPALAALVEELEVLKDNAEDYAISIDDGDEESAGTNSDAVESFDWDDALDKWRSSISQAVEKFDAADNPAKHLLPWIVKDFREDQHPRAGDGRFGSGGGSSAPSSAPASTDQHAAAIPSAAEADAQAEQKISKFAKLISKIPVAKQIHATMQKTAGKLYNALEKRYGKKTAVACLAFGQSLGWGASVAGAAVGVPVWLPGSTIWGALPAVAIAEVYKQVRGLSGKSDVDEEQVREGAEWLFAELVKEYVAELELQGIEMEEEDAE